MSFSEVVSTPRSTSAVSPREVAAKDRIRPPGRVASSAWAKAARPGRRHERAVGPAALGQPRAPRPARRAAASSADRRAERARQRPALGAAGRRPHLAPGPARELHQEQADRPLARPRGPPRPSRRAPCAPP